MTAEQIAEYIFSEHTPLSNIGSREAAIEHVTNLINQYGNERVQSERGYDSSQRVAKSTVIGICDTIDYYVSCTGWPTNQGGS